MFKNKVIPYFFIFINILLLGRVAIFYIINWSIASNSIYKLITIIVESVLVSVFTSFYLSIRLYYKMFEQNKGYRKLDYDSLGKFLEVSSDFMLVFLFFISIISEYMLVSNVTYEITTTNLYLLLFIFLCIGGPWRNAIYMNEEGIYIQQKSLDILFVQMLSIRRVNSNLVNIITIDSNYEFVCNNANMKIIKEYIEKYGVLNRDGSVV